MNNGHKITVEDHEHFRHSLTPLTARDFDEIDEEVADMNPPSRRSERELEKLLHLIDNAPVSSKGGAR